MKGMKEEESSRHGRGMWSMHKLYHRLVGHSFGFKGAYSSRIAPCVHSCNTYITCVHAYTWAYLPTCSNLGIPVHDWLRECRTVTQFLASALCEKMKIDQCTRIISFWYSRNRKEKLLSVSDNKWRMKYWRLLRLIY